MEISVINQLLNTGTYVRSYENFITLLVGKNCFM